MAHQAKIQSAAKKNKQMEKKKQPTEKITLVSPYNEQWPSISKVTEANILETLTRVFKSLNLAKPTKVKIVSKGKKTRKEINAEKRKKAKDIWAKSKRHRQHLVLGMSNSLRSLEKNELCAFLVCRDVEPKLMIEPFVSLCSTRSVVGAAVSDLGTTLQQLLNFKSCKALGLKRCVAENESNVFHELYEVIRRHAPKLNGVQLEIERTIEESRSLVETSISKREEVLRPPEKDYSYLYIKKADVKRVVQSEDFLPLESTSFSDVPPCKRLRSNVEEQEIKTISHNIEYKTMKIKRIQPSNKEKKRARKRKQNKTES